MAVTLSHETTLDVQAKEGLAHISVDQEEDQKLVRMQHKSMLDIVPINLVHVA